MNRILAPKLKRNIVRIIPFGIIWLITGWMFLLTETIVTGNQNLSPDTAVTLTLPVFIFASIAVTLVGLLVGLIELVVLERKFRNYPFAHKVTYKFLIYLGFMLIIMAIFFPVATSIETGKALSDPYVLNRTGNFFLSLTFVNTLVQLSFHLILSLLYAAISENLGHNVLVNFFTGKYHVPQQEQRIFMFLDMKSSTTIAEKLGHVKYFSLLQAYYEMMSDPIIVHRGEVYQYIGDEVVITWKADEGLYKNNCIACFEGIKASLARRRGQFLTAYGVVPDFKAGLHIGEVTTGQIGALKKEIVYTGDVLNTTARIQGQCNTHHTDLIISEALRSRLPEPIRLPTTSIGRLSLRGKNETVPLYAVG
jgi:adenylate cyclase